MRHKLKVLLLIITAVFITVTSSLVNPIKASANTFDVDAEAAILVDEGTGKILFAKNADELLPIASMTKMMTEYLVLEAIDNGEISWDTTTEISDYAYQVSANISSSGIGLIQDKQYTVRQLYEAMAINSDNATTISLAELISGSESEFVRLMNQKAEEMGLPAYEFVNSTGLNNADLVGNHPDGTAADADTLLSAKSTAMLAYNLINDYPESLEFSSQLTSELDGVAYENWNWMLPWEDNNYTQFHVEGVDGLKTGYTSNAGNCFTGTAKRDERRLISVVMNTESRQERFQQTEKLLEYGFGQFESKELYPAGYQLEDKSILNVAKGKEDTVEIESSEAITEVVKSGDEEAYTVQYHIDENLLNDEGELIAPIEKGQTIGTMELVYNGDNTYEYIGENEQIKSVDLITTSAVEKLNWFMLTLGAIGDFFGGIYNTVVDTVTGWF
ncbi:D-alanyl-D-alanine carboxypeptidase DacA [Paraliobacillus quinghaiensis]|uniref:serine-type D-Ala-D-Ala carboxypeptidase n=1 Tax=Paraliobacillus quinghaiensis TaxID=470815 RepID=A0A917TYZ6_9BACI|nr:D-alanyl-D-alanine carboxypeptidase family protein [Paraliobacillus quinghaiensis]GGM43366.1 D-alanyl-D-alanine carboxypeptidase DacA [Paraliobacillus quinghaiensis]